jgi:hypothetical protein
MVETKFTEFNKTNILYAYYAYFLSNITYLLNNILQVYYVRFQVLTAANMEMTTAVWDTAQCTLVEVDGPTCVLPPLPGYFVATVYAIRQLLTLMQITSPSLFQYWLQKRTSLGLAMHRSLRAIIVSNISTGKYYMCVM